MRVAADIILFDPTGISDMVGAFSMPTCNKYYPGMTKPGECPTTHPYAYGATVTAYGRCCSAQMVADYRARNTDVCRGESITCPHGDCDDHSSVKVDYIAG